MEARLECGGVTVSVWRSAGADRALVVQIDTSFEPTDEPFRINLNEARVWGVPYEGGGT